MSRGPAPRNSDERIVQAFSLLEDADAVELKFTVPESDRQSSITVLDLDVLQAELRQVIFFDTPDLRLNRAGVVLRARRLRRGGDAVVKIRPVVPADIPGKLRRSSGFTMEVDVMPGAFVCSGSLKNRVDNSDVKKVVLGKRPIRKLFSPEQEAFYTEHAPKGLGFDSLTPLGPINVVKLKFEAQAFKERMAAAEMWFYPDGSRILELSMKCRPREALHLHAETWSILTRRGITLTGEQQTKTRRALQYFSRIHAVKHK